MKTINNFIRTGLKVAYVISSHMLSAKVQCHSYTLSQQKLGNKPRRKGQ